MSDIWIEFIVQIFCTTLTCATTLISLYISSKRKNEMLLHLLPPPQSQYEPEYAPIKESAYKNDVARSLSSLQGQATKPNLPKLNSLPSNRYLTHARLSEESATDQIMETGDRPPLIRALSISSTNEIELEQVSSPENKGSDGNPTIGAVNYVLNQLIEEVDSLKRRSAVSKRKKLLLGDDGKRIGELETERERLLANINVLQKASERIELDIKKERGARRAIQEPEHFFQSCEVYTDFTPKDNTTFPSPPRPTSQSEEQTGTGN